jgi:ABC-type glutathione transport system ATPase component
MIFQDPFASLDPRFTTFRTLAEPLTIHHHLRGTALRSRAISLLERVGLSESSLDRLPHEFSGGQRQRIAIARALAAEPAVIVADEPTSALDVSVQAQVLTLLEDLQRDIGLAYLFITHDLAVVRRIAHRVAVMRGGRIVELGTTEHVMNSPAHPYTRALLEAAPVPDPSHPHRPYQMLPPINDQALRQIAADHWVAA